MKKYIPILGFLFLVLIAIPVTLLLLKQQQTIKQHASEEDVTQAIAFIESEKITASDVDNQLKEMWGKYYDQAKNDQKAKDNALSLLIKNKLIAKYVADNKISVDSNMATKLTPDKAAEDALTDAYVTSRTVDVASVFKNPTDPNYASQKAKAIASLEKMRTAVQKGATMEQALKNLKKTIGFDTLITVNSNLKIYKNTKWGKEFLDAAFALHKGRVSDVISSPGGSIMILKVVGENETKYTTFDEFLTELKTKYVKIQ